MFRVLVLTILATVFLPLPSAAQSSSAAERLKLFSQQTAILDGRASEQYNNSVRLQPPEVRVPGVPGSIPAYTGKYRGEYLSLALNAARKHGVPEDLFLRLIQQESGWNALAKSPKGAIGLAQLMPGTAKDLRVDPNDPAQNLDGGAKYLAEQFRTFRDWRLALAAYNAGPDAVQKHGGVPPYAETQGYIRAILGS